MKKKCWMHKMVEGSRVQGEGEPLGLGGLGIWVALGIAGLDLGERVGHLLPVIIQMGKYTGSDSRA